LYAGFFRINIIVLPFALLPFHSNQKNRREFLMFYLVDLKGIEPLINTTTHHGSFLLPGVEKDPSAGSGTAGIWADPTIRQEMLTV
jgi:hypothetical protein